MSVRSRPVLDLSKGMLSTIRLNSGFDMPVVGLGMYKVEVGENAYEIALEGLRRGYRHIDTAHVYGNEADVGCAVRDSGIPREEIFITSKLWPGSGGGGYEATKAAFQKAFDKMSIGYIDLYLIHAPTSKATRLEDWRALEDIATDGTGRLRSIGVSNYGVHHLKELAAVSRITPAVNQIELHPFLQRPDIVAYCEAQGMQLVAYSPLAKGLRMLDPRLMSIAAKHGATTAKVMLRWALQRGFCIIPKSSKPARMTENASVVGEGALVLTDEDMTLLDSAEEGLVTGWDPVTGP